MTGYISIKSLREKRSSEKMWDRNMIRREALYWLIQCLFFYVSFEIMTFALIVVEINVTVQWFATFYLKVGFVLAVIGGSAFLTPTSEKN